MKIGLVFPLAGKVGGNDKMLDDMLSVLHEHDLTVYTFGKPFKDYTCNIKSLIPKSFFRVPFLGLYQNLLLQKYYFEDEDFIITIIPIKTTKPTVFYDLNNLFDPTVPQKYRKGLWKWYFKPYQMLRKMSRMGNNTRYYSCSQYSADILAKSLGVKCDVIYPSAALDKVHPTEKKRQICVMGRISPEKNLEYAIEILNGVDVACVIAGSVDNVGNPYLSKLRRLAKPHITFKPNIPRQEFLAIMEESKVYFSASKETFGIATVEAVSCQCVPIVPNNSAHPEVVPFESLRYSSVGDARDKIMRIINNDTVRIAVYSSLLRHTDKFNTVKFSHSLKGMLCEVTA